MNKPPKHTPEDFSDIDGMMLAPRDPDIDKHLVHGTPAIVWRNLDHEKYGVIGLYYDGDKKGFVVTINSPEGLTELFPGHYRTHALFMYDEENKELNICILD